MRTVEVFDVPYSRDMSPRVAALLAAGGGSRFVGPTHKLLALLDERPVWEHSLVHVLAAGFDHVVVVTGAAPLAISRDAVGPPHVDLRHNDDWQRGQATSLQLAVRAADELGADTVTVGLADQPFVTADAWRSVADAPADCRIAIATYEGVPGPNPVRLHRSIWPHLPLEGDEGARGLLRLRPEWVCRVPCLGSLDTVADIDTTEDLHRWKSC
jgi:molybdenum cofactor cytidylyltransferase